MPGPMGWLPPSRRTEEQILLNLWTINSMPRFQIEGEWKTASDKCVLWELPRKYLGHHLPAFNQQVGSCVGHGAAKVCWVLQFFQAARKRLPAAPQMPYEPYNYATSRICAGALGADDGSTGAGAAQAAKSYGVLRSDFPGIPPLQATNREVIFSGTVDRQWGFQGPPSSDIDEGKNHLVKTTSPVTSASDIVAAISNSYPVTIASDWGGEDRPSPQGTPPVLLSRHVTTWQHQMCILGWWKHPTLGLIFRVQNSWGPDFHGTDPDDCPPGGFWITEKDCDYICRQKDSFAYSPTQLFGPAEPLLLSWLFL